MKDKFNSQQGWISLYRSITEKGWYKDSNYVHLWLHLLLRANHKDSEFLFNGKIIKIRPGQFVTGRLKLSVDTGIQQNKIERILKCFKSEQQIEQQTFSKYRVITILSWDTYQRSEQQNEQLVNNKRTTSEQQVNTNNKGNNENNEKKKRIFTPPLVFDVINYFLENGYSEASAKKAFQHYDVANWVDTKGNKVLNWKQKMVSVWFKDENKLPLLINQTLDDRAKTLQGQ